MDYYSIAGIEVEQDLMENNLNVVDNWTVEDIERIFAIDKDPAGAGYTLGTIFD